MTQDIAVLCELYVSPSGREAITTIDKALELYRYDELALSFNGGKDCTVLLHLLRACVHNKILKSENQDAAALGNALKQIRVLYFQPPAETGFPELDSFVVEIVEQCGFSLVVFTCGFKEGLQQFIDSTGVKAIFMGNRRSDPYSGELTHFSPSSAGWPSFMRILPILDWSYCMVWKALREFELPYCSLYDKGYTSVGGRHDTEPNPLLKRPDGSYDPAWKLEDESMERCGRVKR
eukprot:GILK01004810.1.p1 GENE.GILK01004810.1~~GILK01004810.1.p1  ORF type:complete len:235 (+),score=25.67 GILK01004810.1:40-744(+)